MASWSLDASHSEVGFWVRHLMVTKVRGIFKSFSAQLVAEGDDFTSAKVSAEVQMNSIDTRQEQRDAHLRTADFFLVETHPTMTFSSSRIEKKGEGYSMTGDLTLRGVTKPVTFAVSSLGKTKDAWGGTRWGFEAEAVIKRSEFGVSWNQVLEAGGVTVSDEVHIELQAQFVAQK